MSDRQDMDQEFLSEIHRTVQIPISLTGQQWSEVRACISAISIYLAREGKREEADRMLGIEHEIREKFVVAVGKALRGLQENMGKIKP